MPKKETPNQRQWRLLLRFFAALVLLATPIGLMLHSYELGRGNTNPTDFASVIFAQLLIFALAYYLFIKTNQA